MAGAFSTLPMKGAKEALHKTDKKEVTRPRSARRHGWGPPRDVKLKPGDRRAILEALLPERASAKDVVADIEVNLAVFVEAADQPSRAGRRALLGELITAAERFERALSNLDSASWDELSRDAWGEAELPLDWERRAIENFGPDVWDRFRRECTKFGIDAPRSAPPVVPKAVTAIAEAARHHRDRLRGEETRGKRPLVNRDNAVRYFAGLFHGYTTTGRDYRSRLIEFVVAALRAGGLPIPGGDDPIEDEYWVEKVWVLVPEKFKTMRAGPPCPPSRPFVEWAAERGMGWGDGHAGFG
jgi:hypothetical protein